VLSGTPYSPLTPLEDHACSCQTQLKGYLSSGKAASTVVSISSGRPSQQCRLLLPAPDHIHSRGNQRFGSGQWIDIDYHSVLSDDNGKLDHAGGGCALAKMPGSLRGFAFWREAPFWSVPSILETRSAKSVGAVPAAAVDHATGCVPAAWSELTRKTRFWRKNGDTGTARDTLPQLWAAAAGYGSRILGDEVLGLSRR
jgi:hypothetical protein